MRGWRAGVRGSLVFAVAAGIAASFSIDFCNWIFRCGCRSWWAGSDAMCNIHMHGAKHCPWCIYGGQGFVVAFVAVLAAQAGISFGLGRVAWWYRLLLAVAVFPVVGGVVGGIYAWISGYWS